MNRNASLPSLISRHHFSMLCGLLLIATANADDPTISKTCPNFSLSPELSDARSSNAEPASARPSLTLPEGPVDLPDENLPAHVQSQIGKALAGDAAMAATGDLVLDDLLSIIRARGGSVLRGSALDPSRKLAPLAEPDSIPLSGSNGHRESELIPNLISDPSTPPLILQTGGDRLQIHRVPEQVRPASSSRTVPTDSATLDANRWRVAEQLLKSARLLEQDGPLSPRQRELIKAMRVEAANRLRE